MSPKVTIITACFNSESSIASTLESVLSQSYPEIEYLVIDGGSRDGTLSKIDPYRSRISKVVSEKDRGIYDALNKGLRLSSGEIIGFLHSDDRFQHPKVIEHLVDQIEKEKTDGIYSDLEYVRGSGSELSVLRHWKSRPFAPELLRQGWMPPHPTLYLKRQVYERIGEFDLQYRIAADYDLILRAFREPGLRFSYLPEVTVQMQIGGASNGSLGRIFQKSREDYEILSRHGLSPFPTLLRKNLSKIPQFFMRSAP
ncbi:MAG: glycosyltransferase [Proteobacteria bacterium]|nr:glycosyltransferase [Pseudomonadota bacterium]